MERSDWSKSFDSIPSPALSLSYTASHDAESNIGAAVMRGLDLARLRGLERAVAAAQSKVGRCNFKPMLKALEFSA